MWSKLYLKGTTVYRYIFQPCIYVSESLVLPLFSAFWVSHACILLCIFREWNASVFVILCISCTSPCREDIIKLKEISTLRELKQAQQALLEEMSISPKDSSSVSIMMMERKNVLRAFQQTEKNVWENKSKKSWDKTFSGTRKKTWLNDIYSILGWWLKTSFL